MKVTIANNISAEMIVFDSVILLDDKYTALREAKKEREGKAAAAEYESINKVFYLRQLSVFDTQLSTL